jgi:hypothetical protein
MALLLSGAACSDLAFALPGGRDVPYPLDDVSRAVGEELACASGAPDLIAYRGEHVRYQRPLRVHPAFKAQLAQFEQIVSELAQRHFGRAPRGITHFGAYACRPMRNHASWISEHALGNAVDVAGFEFPPLSRRAAEYPRISQPALRRGFSVSVDKDWHAGSRNQEKSAFLHALVDALIARPDVFRSLVGPDYPGHKNHLHLAHPPYRLVKVGEVVRWFW